MAVPPKGYGGTELVVSMLAAGLCERGHDVTLYATGDSTVGTRIRARYPRAIWPPNAYQELRHVLFAMRELVADGGVDVVHAHAAPALAFASLLRVPTIYTIHHTLDPALCELYEETSSRHIRMVAISRRQRELLGCDADVVYHGLDPADYPLGMGRGGHAAFVGRFCRVKGAHVAIRVAQAAGTKIRVGGNQHPGEDAYFRDDLEPLFALPDVECLGEVTHAPKIRLMGDAVATLFPIDWEEPFGLVMIESMLCGTPVLAFPRGSAPEVVDDGITGWLVGDEKEMAERLRALARHPESFDRRRCRAHAIRRFGVDRMVDAYLELYERVAGEGRREDSWAGDGS